MAGAKKHGFKNNYCLPACRLFFIGLHRERSLPIPSKDFGEVLFVRERILTNIGEVKFHSDKSKL